MSDKAALSCSVFYVDDQEDIVWSTTKLLARECPDLTVEGFTEPEKALEALKQQPPDILLTDLRMEGMNGIELMVAARDVVPDLPVIVVTAYGGPDLTAALHGRSLVEYLEKPVRTQSLVTSIDRLLTRSEGFSGAISLPMLPDLIQIYTLSQTTGALSISRRGNAGTIWFDQGKIVHAICGDKSGETAVHELLSWQGGKFSLDAETKPTARTITASWQEVLLEGCRLLDEDGRDVESDEPDEPDDEGAASTQVEMPADFVPRFSSSPAPSEPQTRQRQHPDLSADPVPSKSSTAIATHAIHETLHKLAKIKGCVGAAVFDGTEVSLSPNELGATFDLETAVAGNAEVLGAFQATLTELGIEDSLTDMLITLGKQYHLIRPVNQDQGAFVYLVLDRNRGDLAMARQKLAEAKQLLDTPPISEGKPT